LTDSQVVSLRAVSESLFVKVDALATALQAHIDSLGERADLRTIFPTLQPRLQQAREDYLAAIRRAEEVLTHAQWQQVPEWLRNPAFGRRGPGQQPRRPPEEE
jgi:hypothetical protein